MATGLPVHDFNENTLRVISYRKDVVEGFIKRGICAEYIVKCIVSMLDGDDTARKWIEDNEPDQVPEWVMVKMPNMNNAMTIINRARAVTMAGFRKWSPQLKVRS